MLELNWFSGRHVFVHLTSIYRIPAIVSPKSHVTHRKLRLQEGK